MINTIIFSKDRASQLHALLESFHEKFKMDYKVSIIYKASSSDYEKGYDILKLLWSSCEFIAETDFRQDVINLVSKEYKYVMFLVDDIVFIRNVERDFNFRTFEDKEDVLTLSLFLSPDVTFEYARQKHVKIPIIENNIYNWLIRWGKRRNKKSNEWGAGWDCPMSVGGNIFRTNDFLPYINKVNFQNPNTMESNMQKTPFKSKPLMMCCDKVKLICIPVNVVQSRFKNRHGKIDSKTLNEKWLNGLKIDVSPIYGIETNAIHTILDLNFVEI